MALNKIAVFWFRRDLRLEDNTALHHALTAENPVLPIFIFDTNILNRLKEKEDRRVHYIHQAVEAMHACLQQHGSALRTYVGNPLDVFKEICAKYAVEAVYCNRDYEPDAIRRDTEVRTWLQSQKVGFHDYKDQVIFEKSEIVKNDGKPYTVYTPYAKKWKSTLQPNNLQTFETDFKHFMPYPATRIHPLAFIGFEKTDMKFQFPELNKAIICDYDKYRDYPSLDHTSHLSVALRFGTISIRKCVSFALKHNEAWLSELIWREFFMQIMFHFPHVETCCFRKEYENIAWRNDEEEFKSWCDGNTGYPIVDAGMTQLNQTGFMHNRVRMIVASFLTKHLLIDWRWGEAYFAQKLVDYDLAANNGNWQWAAGCGCDAAPYFRIFNPASQIEKFDREWAYIRRWNPEFESKSSSRIVKHEEARERALETYRKALKTDNK
jgi:deoxyribodipyrimidine photo-lyase